MASSVKMVITCAVWVSDFSSKMPGTTTLTVHLLSGLASARICGHLRLVSGFSLDDLQCVMSCSYARVISGHSCRSVSRRDETTGLIMRVHLCVSFHDTVHWYPRVPSTAGMTHGEASYGDNTPTINIDT